MTSREPLSSEAIEAALGSLEGWSYDDGALARRYELADFRSAMGFMVRIGFEAETLDHHPELRNVYNRVDVRLTTHDAGDQVTAKDVELARRIDAVFRD